MKQLLNLLFASLLLNSCDPQSTPLVAPSASQSIVTLEFFQFSPSLSASFKEYMKEIRSTGSIDSCGYGIFIQNMGPDSSVYYFHSFFTLDEISFRSMIVGIGYIDSVPVVVSTRNKEFAVNYDSTNRMYLEFIKKSIPLKERHTMIIDHPTYRSVYYKEDSIRSEPAALSPVVPERVRRE